MHTIWPCIIHTDLNRQCCTDYSLGRLQFQGKQQIVSGSSIYLDHHHIQLFKWSSWLSTWKEIFQLIFVPDISVHKIRKLLILFNKCERLEFLLSYQSILFRPEPEKFKSQRKLCIIITKHHRVQHWRLDFSHIT